MIIVITIIIITIIIVIIIIVILSNLLFSLFFSGLWESYVERFLLFTAGRHQKTKGEFERTGL